MPEFPRSDASAPPRTFVCYRGSSTGSTVGEEIAKYLACDVLSREKDFAPVFFAEKSHYDFINDLEPIFQSIEKVIVVFSVNFFSGFFLDAADAETVTPNPESSTLRELETAFRHGCELYAVFSGEFSWSQIDEAALRRLEKHFGRENLGRLRHVSNPYVWKQTENRPEQILEFFNKASLHGARQFLRTLGPETERRFEDEVTKYAKRNNTDVSRAYLRELIESAGSGEEAYAAFYLLLVMLRQLKEFGQMRELFERFGARFSDRSSYSHIRVLYLIECGEEFDAGEALTLSWRDCEEYPGNAGFVHLFADVYATACERAEPEARRAVMAEWDDRASRMADLAIELDRKYAKYYCTKARILALRKDYRQAEQYISLAIEKEDSRRQDYLIRLLNYQYYKIMIQVDKKLDRLGREALT